MNEKEHTNTSKPEIHRYSSEERVQKVFFQRSSGETAQGFVTGEATVGDTLRYEVTFMTDENHVATKLIEASRLEQFDAQERERHTAAAHDLGEVATKQQVQVMVESFRPPEGSLMPPHADDELRDARHRSQVMSNDNPLIEMPDGWVIRTEPEENPKPQSGKFMGDPRRVIGHPSNPLSPAIQAYGGHLKRAEGMSDDESTR